MTIGKEMAYRRGKRGKDATGSLVFDQERQQTREEGPKPGKKVIATFPV